MSFTRKSPKQSLVPIFFSRFDGNHMVDVQGEQSTNDDGNEVTDAERNSSESFQFVLHWF